MMIIDLISIRKNLKIMYSWGISPILLTAQLSILFAITSNFVKFIRSWCHSACSPCWWWPPRWWGRCGGCVSPPRPSPARTPAPWRPTPTAPPSRNAAWPRRRKYLLFRENIYSLLTSGPGQAAALARPWWRGWTRAGWRRGSDQSSKQGRLLSYIFVFTSHHSFLIIATTFPMLCSNRKLVAVGRGILDLMKPRDHYRETSVRWNSENCGSVDIRIITAASNIWDAAPHIGISRRHLI